MEGLRRMPRRLSTRRAPLMAASDRWNTASASSMVEICSCASSAASFWAALKLKLTPRVAIMC